MTKQQPNRRRKSPAWKAQYKLKAQLVDEAIERGHRVQAVQVVAALFEPKNVRDLVRDSDQVFQWLMYGNKPTTFSVVDMSAAVLADDGC